MPTKTFVPHRRKKPYSEGDVVFFRYMGKYNYGMVVFVKENYQIACEGSVYTIESDNVLDGQEICDILNSQVISK